MVQLTGNTILGVQLLVESPLRIRETDALFGFMSVGGA